MSTIDCSACDNLRENAPEYVINGTTSTICASLANDTGLNPNLSTLHTNDEDLHDVNDCTIGRMAQEIEGYDVCDWKEFMQKYVPNNYELLKAMICSEGGQWTNIHDLWDFAKDICEKVEMAMWPTGTAYGVLPYATVASRQIGTINKKNGTPLLTVQERSLIPERYQPEAGAGIFYTRKKTVDCDNHCRIYEWIEPWFYRTYLSESAAYGDILWYAPKSTLQDTLGMTDVFWDRYSYEARGYTFNGTTASDHSDVWVQIVIDAQNMGDDYLTLVYRGSGYPSHSQGGLLLSGAQGDTFQVTVSNC